MLTQEILTSGVTEERSASIVRALVSGLIALAIPYAFSVISLITTHGRGMQVNGFGPFAGWISIVFVVDFVISRASRLRTVWLGALFTLPMAIGSATVRGSVLGAALILLVGFAAGWLAMRGDNMFPVTSRGYQALAVVAALVVPLVLLSQRGSAEGAALQAAPDDAKIMAGYERGRDAWFVFPNNVSWPGDGRGLVIFQVRKGRWHWEPAS
ncbi:MAG: hypothetical protein LC723_06835, partial [Actinobacteria bacterium]|nr:hypothetical protein [Actinomycetota bacterium]